MNMRVGEYALVRLEHIEVSVRDNFKFLLELRYKLEKIRENEIKRYENGDDMIKKKEWRVVAMDQYTTRARVKDARVDDIKATTIKEK